MSEVKGRRAAGLVKIPLSFLKRCYVMAVGSCYCDGHRVCGLSHTGGILLLFY